MALAERIDNYPGFEAGIEGFALGEKMRMGAERFAHVRGAIGYALAAQVIQAYVQ